MPDRTDRPTPARRALITAAALALVAAPTWLFAGPLSGLTDFTPGTTISAAAVNANFAAVETEVTNNDGRIQALEGTVTKYQKKQINADHTSNSDISGLTFNNLTVGKTYRVYLQARLDVGGVGQAEVRINNGTDQVARVVHETETANIEQVQSAQAVFQATATTVTFQAVLTGTNARVAGSTNAYHETWAMLEELPGHQVTTEW